MSTSTRGMACRRTAEASQQSVRGRSSCAGYGIEVKLGGVPVRPGDFILADDNGTVVIPNRRPLAELMLARE